MNINPTFSRQLSTFCILFGILSLTFWIRIQGVADIPDGQFSSNDAYVFYTQAQTISRYGNLPERDMQRWLPSGRDNRQFLSLYAYAIAYIHKAITLFYHQVTLYQVQLYTSPLCFILGLSALLIFIIKYYGTLLAMVIGVLMATFPGTIVRSTAGFGDRDAWCWMLAVFAMTLYLYKERMQPGRRKYLATALCGFLVFLGGLSWEAFGVFVLIILSAEIWKFCSTDTEQNLKEYLIWILMFAPWLYLISPAYRSGYGFSTYVGPLLLAPSLLLLVLKSIRYMLLRFVKQVSPYARQLAWGLTLCGIGIGGSYVILQYKTFATTAFPFMETPLMKTVGELKNPSIIDWVDRYGSLFALGSIGLIASAAHYWKWKSLTLTIGFALFYITMFFTDFIHKQVGHFGGNLLFIAALALTTIGFGIAATQKQQQQRYEQDLIMLLVWSFLWGCFSRTGIRYIFFLGIPLAVGAATLLKHIATFPNLKQISIRFLKKTFHPKHITAGIIAAMLLLLLFWRPIGGYATATLLAAAKREAIPGHSTMTQAYQWIKNELPHEKTVIAAHWTYGIKLNALARVKTITDSDHYLPHWVHLYFRHVFCAQSEIEALHFLKTHNATHLLINSDELVPNAGKNSWVGSDENLDRHFEIHRLHPHPTALGTQYTLKPEIGRKTTQKQTKTLNRIDVTGIELEKLSITAKFETEALVQLPYIAFHGEKRITSTTHSDTDKGGLIFIFDKNKVLMSSFYIPEIGWNSLAVKLFMRGKHSNAFENVNTIQTYEKETHPAIQIWKINYPENIKPHPKYLATE